MQNDQTQTQNPATYTPDQLQQFATDALSRGYDPVKVSKVLQNHGYTLNQDGTISSFSASGANTNDNVSSLNQTYGGATQPTQTQNPSGSTVSGQSPSVGGFANNALNDVGDLVTGVLSIPGAVGTALSNPQKGGEMAKSLVANTLGEYNDLLGQPVKNDNGKLSLQLPNIGEAASHAYQHPVDTVLDLLPFVKPIQGLAAAGKAGEAAKALDEASLAGKTAEEAQILSGTGKTAETASTLPKMAVSDGAAQTFLGGYNVPGGKAGTRLNPVDTAKTMINDGITGSPTEIATKIDPITGSNGVIEKVKRAALGSIKDTVDTSTAGTVGTDGLNSVADLAEKPGVKQVYQATLNNLLPKPQTLANGNIGGANALDTYDSIKNIEAKGYSLLRQGTDVNGNVINTEKADVGQVFLNVADELESSLNSKIGSANIVDNYKTPGIINTLNEFSPQFAQRYQNAKTFSDLRALQAPYVRMGKIIDYTQNAGTTSSSTLGSAIARGTGAAIGGGIGSLVAPGVGTYVGAGIGAMAEPAIQSAAMKFLPKISSNVAANMDNVAGIAKKAGSVAKYTAPVIGAQGNESGTQVPGGENGSNPNTDQNANQDSIHTSSVADVYGEFKRDPNGNYSLPSLNAQTVIPSYMSYGTYINLMNQAGNNEVQIGKINSAYQASQDLTKEYLSKHSLSGDETQFMQSANKINDLMNDVYHRVQTLPPNILNNVKTVDQLKQYNNGQYATLASEIITMQMFYGYLLQHGVVRGFDIQNAKNILPQVGNSPQEFNAKLDFAHKLLLDTYRNDYIPYTLSTQALPGVQQNQFSPTQQ